MLNAPVKHSQLQEQAVTQMKCVSSKVTSAARPPSSELLLGAITACLAPRGGFTLFVARKGFMVL